MPRVGDEKKAPCTGSEKCKKLRYTKWVYGYETGWLSNTYFWKCLTCGTIRKVGS